MITFDETEAKEIGDNLSVIEKGGKMILIIDPSKTIGLSSTGKTMGIASTNGFTFAGFGLKLNLYLGKKV